jgi:hypothetical protein
VACFAANPRVSLAPRFVPGETLTYRAQINSATSGKTATPITDNEGATQTSLNITLRQTLQVLSIASSSSGAIVRMRLTWEEAHATSSTDALDPTSSDPAAPFSLLEGQSVEFTLSSDGGLANFSGLEKVFANGIPPPESVAWISSLVSANRFPHDGVSVGQEWKSESPITGAPLAGLSWQTKSTYQGNEPCGPSSGPQQQAPSSGRQCAVIIGQMNIVRHGGGRGSGKGDTTPDDYLHNGLRTAGTWSGAGEELGTIDLENGILVSATENSTQDTDYEIRSESSGSVIHYVAKVQTQTGITLIEDSRPSAPGHS